MDWTGCSEVEQVPGKLSGVALLKKTRMQADLVLDNYEAGLTVAEIAEIYTLRLEQVHAVIDFAIFHRVDQQHD